MDKFRVILNEIQDCIEMHNGTMEGQLKHIWNELSDAITEVDNVNHFKDPIDICIIPDVYEVMKNYRNNHLKNQQMKLAGSCKVIKIILMNCNK